MPKIGDMIVKTCLSTRKEYVGIVYELTYQRWGSYAAFINWSSEVPPTYKEKHGYVATNIYNLRDEFQIIRNGENIT